MTGAFRNAYDDAQRAGSYAGLDWPGTYHLAWRELNDLIRPPTRGRRALDFGCGTGRSTRLLAGLGYEAQGIDISPAMVEQARARDPRGDYRVVAADRAPDLPPGAYALVLASYTFDNIPLDSRPGLLDALRRSLEDGGRLVIVASTPLVYTHEWVSFTTAQFPDNRAARDGDRVRIVMLDVPDQRPIEDILCSDEGHRRLFRGAGLAVLDVRRPLGRAGEPWRWASEERIAPWSIYVLGASPREGR